MASDNHPRPADDSAAAAQAAPRPPADSPPPRKRRRWPRRLGIALLVVIVVLAVLVGLLPYIVSRPAVYTFALSFANDALRGTIEVQGLSLSWGGPTEVRGLRVLDADDREVLQVPKITCASGVWRLLTAAESFGDVVIDKPRVDLRVTPENEITLAQAFEARQPSASAPEAGPLPEPRGRIVIHDGAVRVSRDSGAPFEVSALNGDLAIESLADVAGKLEMTLANGGKLVTEAAIRGLVSGGALSTDAASGTLHVHTDGDIEIGPVADVAAPDSGLTARANLRVDATLTDGNLHAELATSVSDLQTRQRAAPQSAPVNLSLTGQVDMTSEQITARTELTGEAGNANANIVYQRSDRPVPVTLDSVLSAIITGEDTELPDLSVDAQANVDLVALEKAMPGLLHLRPDQQITGGRLEVAELAVRGGRQPTASGRIELKDLAARSGDREVRLEPISLGFDTRLEAGQGLEIRRAELTSSFSHVVASGAASNLRAEFQSDLTKLKQELGQVFELGSFELGGELAGTLELTQSSDERVDVSAQATANSLHYASEGRRLDLPKASFNHAGHLALAGGKVTRVVAAETKADLNGEVILAGNGWYDLPQAAFHADLDVQQAELGFAARRADDLGVAELGRYGGTVRLQADIDRAARDAPITSGGQLVAQDLVVDGQALVPGQTQVSWTGVQLAPDATDVRVARAELASEPAALTATDIHWRSGEHLVMDGKLAGTADLARCLRAVGLIARMEEPPDIAGHLTVDTNCTTSGDTVTVVGRGNVDQLEVGAGDQAVREERLQFQYNAQLDQRSEKITLTEGRLASTPLSAEISGTIDKYRTTRVLALSGRYDASWKELTTLLHELAPATAETIVVTGQSTSRFEITGPASQPEVQPPFRGVDAGLDVGWKSAEVYGVPMGSAKLSPALHDGRFTLPRTTIPAATGKVNLGGVVDFQADEPTLEVRGKLALLEDIAVTPELASSLLSRINPIFMHLTRASGTVHLNVQDVILPLGATAKTRSAGLGRLDLIEMMVQPSGLLGELLALGGLEQGRDYAVDVSGLDFELKEGRLFYEDFTLTFTKEFNLKFYGSVGLDETLDLVVSVPIHAALLERLGVRGPVAEYAQFLAGARVDIPLVGTRSKPKLDLKRVDVKALVERAVKASSGKVVDDLLQGLLRGKQEPPPKDQPGEGQAEKQPPPKEQPKKEEPKQRQPQKKKPKRRPP